MDIATLGLRVDGSGAIRTLDNFSRSSDRVARSGAAAERVIRDLQRALAALGVYFGARELIDYADEWKLVQGRIGLVTKSYEQMMIVQRRVFDIAQRARQPLVATADLYTKLARNADQLGKSQRQILTVTEAVTKAMTVSGATTMEAEASIRQLGQAMGSGALRGDELNAILEQAPRLAQAIADGMGVTVGQLRRLGAQGKLTSREVFEAIESQADAIESEFTKLPTTVRQSITVLRNEIQRYVGLLDNASGVSKTLSEWIIALSRNLNTVVALIGAVVTGWIAYNVATKSAAAYTLVLTSTQTISAFIALAKSVRSVADAMALVSLLGRGALGIAAGVAAATIGFVAYKKLLEDITQQTGKWAESLDSLDGATNLNTGVITDDILAQRAANEDMVRLAAQSAHLAGMNEKAAARQRVEYEAINKRIAAQRDLKGQILEETLAAIEEERRLGHIAIDNAERLEAVTKKYEALQNVVRNLVEGMQRTFADFFNDVFTKGVASFKSLFDTIRNLFFRTLSEMLSAQIMKKLAAGLSSAMGLGALGAVSVASAPAQASGATSSSTVADVTLDPIIITAKKSMMSQLMNVVGPALFGAAMGYGFGNATGSSAIGGFGGALSGAGAGFMMGGPVGAIVGGLAGLGAGILGAHKKQQEEERRRQELLRQNNVALDRLRERISGSSFGDRLSLGDSAITRLQQALTVEKLLQGIDLSSLKDDMRLVRKLADELGITLIDSEGKFVVEGLEQLREAIELTIESITKFGNNLDDLERRQNAYNKLFDVEMTPTQQLIDAYDILMKAAPDLMRQMGLANLNLYTAEGRSVLLEGLRDIFRMIEAGEFTPELLGAFADKNQLIDAILRAKDGLDAFKKSLVDAATDIPKAINLALYEQMHASNPGQDLWDDPVPAPTPPPVGGVTPLTSASRASGPVSISLVFQPGSIVNEAGDTPEIFAEKMQRAAIHVYNTGGHLYMPGIVTEP